MCVRECVKQFSLKLLQLHTGYIQSWKTWKSHRIPFYFSRPGKVMEIESRFWKIHKRSWKLKGILLQNGVVPFFHPAFQYKDLFMYSDQILVSSTSSSTVTRTLCVVLKGKTGLSHLPSWPRYMSHVMKHVKGP